MNAIAYVDDDLHNLKHYKELLSTDFSVDTYLSGTKLLESINHQSYDCFVVDIYMPQLSGFELVKEIRNNHRYKRTPVFFVTSSPEDNVKIQSYEFLAADFFDRLTKRDELVARIKNRIELFRVSGEELRVGNLSIVPTKVEASLAGQRLNLTLIEYKILHFFALNQSLSLSKQELVEYLWPNEVVNANNLNTHIYNLRQKVESWDHEIIGDRKKGFFLLKK